MLVKIIAMLCGLLFSHQLFAISETNYQLDYANKVIPLMQKMEEGFFAGKENVLIHFKNFERPEARNCLVILPGRSEPVEKYAEVIYDLLQTPAGKNLSFYLMDHRGQGQSGRMASPSDMGYVDHFDNFVLDLETFIYLMNLGQKCEHKFLLAHSMGAGIASAYILKYPNSFERVVLISPMLKVFTKPYSYEVARAIVTAQTLFGRGDQFAIGQKGFNPEAKFEDNRVTTSRERFKMSMDLNDLFPATQLGGVSNRFVLETMKGTAPIRSRYNQIAVPLLVFNAGIETYSVPEEMVKLCEEAQNCKRTFYPTAKHELLMERDEVRDGLLKEIEIFFQ